MTFSYYNNLFVFFTNSDRILCTLFLIIIRLLKYYIMLVNKCKNVTIICLRSILTYYELCFTILIIIMVKSADYVKS